MVVVYHMMHVPSATGIRNTIIIIMEYYYFKYKQKLKAINSKDTSAFLDPPPRLPTDTYLVVSSAFSLWSCLQSD